MAREPRIFNRGRKGKSTRPSSFTRLCVDCKFYFVDIKQGYTFCTSPDTVVEEDDPIEGTLDILQEVVDAREGPCGRVAARFWEAKE